MNYKEFKQEMIDNNGDIFTTVVSVFFEKAVEFAKDENYQDALEIANDALIFYKYSNIGYPVVYLIGMLCQAYLDNDKPEKADELFKIGVAIIDKNHFNFEEDINNFLDLKIIIDEELKKKELEE